MEAEHTFDGANRIDTRFVYHTAMRVLTVEMSCTWLDNRAWERTKQYPGKIVQLNVIIDVFWGGWGGGWSKELDVDMRFLEGARSSDVLKRMQKAVLSSSLNIARTFNR